MLNSIQWDYEKGIMLQVNFKIYNCKIMMTCYCHLKMKIIFIIGIITTQSHKTQIDHTEFILSY